MKCTLFTLALVLALTPAVHAQEHQHQQADSSRAIPMEHGGMMSMEDMKAMMPHMMRMHERMMADSTIHRMMMADPEMRQMTQQMMGGEMDMAEMHQRMAAMPPDERRQMMQQMHARMMERMEAMPPDERQAMMQRMMEAHRRLMADPAVHERMMADPEMREMMEQMYDGRMDHEGMQHDGMDHGQMGAMQYERRSPAPMSTNDARAAEAASRTVDRFHAALAAGDRGRTGASR